MRRTAGRISSVFGSFSVSNGIRQLASLSGLVPAAKEIVAFSLSARDVTMTCARIQRHDDDVRIASPSSTHYCRRASRIARTNGHYPTGPAAQSIKHSEDVKEPHGEIARSAGSRCDVVHLSHHSPRLWRPSSPHTLSGRVERHGRPDNPEDLKRHLVVDCDGLDHELPGRTMDAVSGTPCHGCCTKRPLAGADACSESRRRACGDAALSRGQ